MSTEREQCFCRQTDCRTLAKEENCGKNYEQIKKEIPYQVGVYVPDGMNYRGEWYDLKAIKKAKRKDRSRPVSEMLLMMFRSAARDRKKALSDGH